MADSSTVGKILWLSLPPVLILFGSVGNILSIVIVARRKKYNRSSVYLIALASADLLILYTGLLSIWIGQLTQTDISSLPTALCKLLSWLIYASGDCAVYTLVILTLERILAMLAPHWFRTKCTKIRAYVAIVTVWLCSLLVNMHFLFGLGQRDYRVGNLTLTATCAPVSEEYQRFHFTVLPGVNFVKSTCLPLSIIFIGSSIMLASIAASKCNSARRINVHVSSVAVIRRKQIAGLTRMTLILNLVFLLCKTPMGLYVIFDSDVFRNGQVAEFRTNAPPWVLVNILLYLNHAVNFMLYSISGSGFRKELKQFFYGRSRRQMAVVAIDVPGLFTSSESGSRPTGQGGQAYLCQRPPVLR